MTKMVLNKKDHHIVNELLFWPLCFLIALKDFSLSCLNMVIFNVSPFVLSFSTYVYQMRLNGLLCGA